MSAFGNLFKKIEDMDPEMQIKIKEMMEDNKKKQHEMENAVETHHLDGLLPKEVMEQHRKEYAEHLMK